MEELSPRIKKLARELGWFKDRKPWIDLDSDEQETYLGFAKEVFRLRYRRKKPCAPAIERVEGESPERKKL